MSQVSLVDVETIQKSDTFSAVISLDNGERYQLRVVTDSIGNVYSWIDRAEKYGKWSQLAEFRNGEPRVIVGKTHTNS